MEVVSRAATHAAEAGGHRGRAITSARAPAAAIAADKAPCDRSHFGHRLARAMQLRGHFKAAALACAVGVNEAAISRWKRGGPITLPHAVRLCETLDVSMDWLIRGVGQPLAHLRPEGMLLPPAISERTVDEVRSLLHFIECRANARLAQGASGR